MNHQNTLKLGAADLIFVFSFFLRLPRIENHCTFFAVVDLLFFDESSSDQHIQNHLPGLRIIIVGPHNIVVNLCV